MFDSAAFRPDRAAPAGRTNDAAPGGFDSHADREGERRLSGGAEAVDPNADQVAWPHGQDACCKPLDVGPIHAHSTEHEGARCATVLLATSPPLVTAGPVRPPLHRHRRGPGTQGAQRGAGPSRHGAEPRLTMAKAIVPASGCYSALASPESAAASGGGGAAHVFPVWQVPP